MKGANGRGCEVIVYELMVWSVGVSDMGMAAPPVVKSEREGG